MGWVDMHCQVRILSTRTTNCSDIIIFLPRKTTPSTDVFLTASPAFDLLLRSGIFYSSDFDTANSIEARKYLKTYGLTPPGVDSFEKQEQRCETNLHRRDEANRSAEVDL